MSRFLSAGAFLLVASALAGCSGPIGPSNYGGDPLLIVPGEVTSTEQEGDKEIVLVWQVGSPPSMNEIVPDLRVRVPQTTRTDPWFTIRIYDPPPQSLPLQRLADGEVAFARANLVAIPLGWRPDTIEPQIVEEQAGFGVGVRHWIVYLYGPAEAGTLTAWWLGAPLVGLGPEYHLVRADPAPCMTAEQRTACVEEVLAMAGVPDAATAGLYCDAPYRLSPVNPWEVPAEIEIGIFSGPPAPDCPP